MFKKTKLAAVSAAILGSVAMQNASAVSFDVAGTAGQVLIFPYYNVNNGYQTSYNIRNTKDEFKAVKLRFRESGNSNDVLDFNVYMSPYDVFTVTLTRSNGGDDPDASDTVLLTTEDTTCTFPAIPEGGVKFITDIYPATGPIDAREGYLEVIEMGVIAYDQNMQGMNPIVISAVQEGIRHVPIDPIEVDGVLVPQPATPPNCNIIGQTWGLADNLGFTQGGAVADYHWVAQNNQIDFPFAPATASATTTGDGFYSTESGSELAPGQTAGGTTIAVDGIPNNLMPPSGGIEGISILLGITNAAAWIAEAEVVAHWSDYPQHYLSDDIRFYLLPSLASGSGARSMTADFLLDSGQAQNNTWTYTNFDWGWVNGATFDGADVPSGVNPMPISNVLAATEVNNEYFINPDFNAATDWVITFPMKKYGIFTEDSAITIQSRFWDREEQEATPADAGFSPPRPGETQVLEREANVVEFTAVNNVPEDLLGSNFPNIFELDEFFAQGWASFKFQTNAANPYDLASLQGKFFLDLESKSAIWLPEDQPGVTGYTKGVPAHGFAAIRSLLGDGSARNVGETFDHAWTRDR